MMRIQIRNFHPIVILRTLTSVEALSAFCVREEEHDFLASEAVFLGRVVREERMDALELLTELESSLHEVEQELEFRFHRSAWWIPGHDQV